MAKDTEQIKKLKYELGDLTYAMGQQRKKYNKELEELQKMEKLVNDKATEIENLDG